MRIITFMGQLFFLYRTDNDLFTTRNTSKYRKNKTNS